MPVAKPAAPTPALRIDLARARAHWHARTGLAEPVGGAPDEVIARTGWIRTLGGVDVYLAMRARVPGLRRATLDALVEASRVRVMPAVRGCIYLVPAVHAPLASRVASEHWRKGADRDLERAGSSWQEVDDVAHAVAQVLARGPLTTDAIRKAIPEGTVRSLGERGKKVGLASPLPVALRHLEFNGAIERTLEGGRLDTERYVWRTAKPDRAAPRVPDDPIDRFAAIARIFATAAGPITIGDLASWAMMSQRDARAAIERAGLVPVAVDGFAELAWVADDDVAALRERPAPSRRVTLLSFEDTFCVAHGGPRWVVDPAQWSRKVKPWGGTKGGTLGDVAHLLTRTFCVGDQLAGIWEMDPDAGQVLWASFTPLAREARAELDKLATDTARFLEEDLGHARSFSLDTEDSIRERAAEVARTASGGDDKAAKPRAKPKAKKAASKKPTPKKPPKKPAKKPKR